MHGGGIDGGQWHTHTQNHFPSNLVCIPSYSFIRPYMFWFCWIYVSSCWKANGSDNYLFLMEVPLITFTFVSVWIFGSSRNMCWCFAPSMGSGPLFCFAVLLGHPLQSACGYAASILDVFFPMGTYMDLVLRMCFLNELVFPNLHISMGGCIPLSWEVCVRVWVAPNIECDLKTI